MIIMRDIFTSMEASIIVFVDSLSQERPSNPTTRQVSSALKKATTELWSLKTPSLSAITYRDHVECNKYPVPNDCNYESEKYLKWFERENVPDKRDCSLITCSQVRTHSGPKPNPTTERERIGMSQLYI